ncbi:MAG: hypothetical protein WC676_04510 [Candidatus Omnitrophota bacterium]
MNIKFLRVFKRVDVDDVKGHLLICGDLSASCSKCAAVGIKLDSSKCPECQTDFRYVTFRNIKENMPKVQRLSEPPLALSVIDFDDYKKITGAQKAEDFFR